MISALAVSGYRSLRDVRLELGPLNVVTGANGAGKSSLYRALRLLADAAQGRVVAPLAAEGGMPSALWAGPETVSAAMKRGDVRVEGSVRRKPVSLKLGFGGDDYGYAVDLGRPVGQARPPSRCSSATPRSRPRRPGPGRASSARPPSRGARGRGRACCPRAASGARCLRRSARPTA